MLHFSELNSIKTNKDWLIILTNLYIKVPPLGFEPRPNQGPLLRRARRPFRQRGIKVRHLARF